jgi:hypothetical protein
MENLEKALDAWRAETPQRVKLGAIKQDPALQPRTPDVVPAAFRPRRAAESDDHIDHMRAQLDACNGHELEPLLSARINGALYLVDGHHRLTAYRRARRKEAPVRVRDMDMRSAVALSKLVNCDGAKLRMHDEQSKDAAWQYMAIVTVRGRAPLGESLRAFAARFGIGHETARRMRDRLPTIRIEDYSSAALDPGTGWPRWKYVKSSGFWKDRDALLRPDEKHRRRVEKGAAQLWKQCDRHGTDVFRDALRLFAMQAADHNDETEAEAAAACAEALVAAEGSDF